MTDEKKEYKNIFQTTFLFGFVQVFNILIKVALNKIAALLIGASGIGTIGLFNNTIRFLNAAGLGVSQSAVKDISEANAIDDKERFSETISIVNKIIIGTALLGVVITIVLSPLLSKWTFGNSNYTFAYSLLSLAVGIGILSDGQLAILKGMRQLRALAKASLWGAVIGFISAVPFYYFLRDKGIVPVIIITALAILFFSNLYVRKIDYKRISFTLKELRAKSLPMVKMGIALMLVGFLSSLSELIVTAYISKQGGVSVVGYYQAGVIIISSYFGVILTAMATDYYPRISAVNTDNILLQKELNQQSEVGLLIAYPIVILFLFFSPVIIKILYTEQFIHTIQYTDYAVLGMTIVLCSNNMGMILLAKQVPKIFLVMELSQKFFITIMYLFLYKFYGLLGLGIGYFIMAIIHITLNSIVLNHFYSIRFSKYIYGQLILILVSVFLIFFVRQIEGNLLKYIFGLVLFTFSLFYSNYRLKDRMGIDLYVLAKRKIRRHK